MLRQEIKSRQRHESTSLFGVPLLIRSVPLFAHILLVQQSRRNNLLANLNLFLLIVFYR